jgi:hypothetical protein
MPRTPLADPQIASHCQPATMKLQLDEFLDIGASSSAARRRSRSLLLAQLDLLYHAARDRLPCAPDAPPRA